jgi:Tfp pilus assembly protein PilN
MLFSIWQAVGFLRFNDLAEDLRAAERDARVEWEYLGEQVQTVEARLDRPESVALLEEIQFLDEVIQRKGFSWIALLNEIENVIPRSVYLRSLVPEVAGAQTVLVQMEARGKSIDDLSAFISGLEGTAAFRDVKVSIEERGDVAGQAEIRVLMNALYTPATKSEVSAP